MSKKTKPTKPTTKVYRNDGSVPVEDIMATTFQMDDFYREIGQGRVSGLNTFNLLQHYKAGVMSDGVVLDVCCGRSLMLPILVELHNAGKIKVKEYIGVDIASENQTAKHCYTATGEKVTKDTYPFEVTFIESNVANMTTPKKMKKYINTVDIAIYTSAIEHMPLSDQKDSLKECQKLLKPGGTLCLSGPRSLEEDEVPVCNKKGKNADQFDVRYSAHLYEPRLSEVYDMLWDAGFNIDLSDTYGIYGDTEDIEDMIMSQDYPELSYFPKVFEYLPEEYLRSIFFIQYRERCSEYLVIQRKD
jgi:SAM-dependent methyltransferase